jgi:hypothetical protein
MICLYNKSETTKSATRLVSTKSRSTEYQVFLRSETKLNEPSNELLKATKVTKWRDVVRSGAGTICTDEKEVAGKLKIDTFQIFLELKMLFVKYP